MDTQDPMFTEEMTMKKRSMLTALFLSAALTLSLSACGSTDSSQTPSATGDGTYTVGICQLVQHSAHDEATLGFMAALNEALPGKVTFLNKTASNDINACSGIVNQFISEEVDLILANATPALQIASAATNKIPILGTSITDYAAALDLKDFNGTVGGNISGTSDLAPPDQQAAMIREWFPFPETRTVGLLYCSAEANSKYQADIVGACLKAMGYACETYTFTDANDLTLVVQDAVNDCDVIYVPTDNTVATNAGIIDNICRSEGVPVIGGEKGICSGCAVATLSISYYDIGYTTGQMAVKILTGEADIATMPIAYASCSGMYNPELCAALGLTPPSDVYAPITAD